MRDLKHCFALYYQNLKKEQGEDFLKITDSELCHRVAKVLRLRHDDQLNLFGKRCSVLGSLVQIGPKEFVLGQLVWSEIEPLQPHLTVAFGFLKREHLSEALYNCAELGANEIQPIVFQKSIIQPLNQDRVEKILVAAAEQSKNFSLPVWREPQTFQQFLKTMEMQADTAYIYCDPDGASLPDVIVKLKNYNYATKFVLIIGPEGGLTSEERLSLQHPKIIWLRLTPTILRATQAIAVAVGAVRASLP